MAEWVGGGSAGGGGLSAEKNTYRMCYYYCRALLSRDKNPLKYNKKSNNVKEININITCEREYTRRVWELLRVCTEWCVLF
jgi:hypothetical protein